MKWQPTSVFLPGESCGQRSLVGCCLWGLTESDTTKVTYQQQPKSEPCMLRCFSHVWLFATLWTVCSQVPLSMGFPRQEHLSGFPFLLQQIFPTWGSNLCLLCLLHCRQILYYSATGEAWIYPVNCTLPGSSVHGISQARTLEWVSIFSSKRSSQPGDQTCVSCVFCVAGRFFTTQPPGKPESEPWTSKKYFQKSHNGKENSAKLFLFHAVLLYSH